MDLAVINSLYGYFETLYNLNRKMLQICGVDILNERHNILLENKILEIIQDIPRLIPYGKKKGNLFIENNDGLIEFSDKLIYIQVEYEEILKRNYNTLLQIKDIRNQYEHKIHGAKITGTGSGTTELFDLTFHLKVRNNGVEEEVDYILYSSDIIKLIKDLNNLFAIIQNQVLEFLDLDENYKEYYYYKRLSRFSFLDFNNVYDNIILKTIGKILLDF